MTTFWEDGEKGLILEILFPFDYYSRALGCYPEFVFRVLKDDGEIAVWDFYKTDKEENHEFVVICEAR